MSLLGDPERRFAVSSVRARVDFGTTIHQELDDVFVATGCALVKDLPAIFIAFREDALVFVQFLFETFHIALHGGRMGVRRECLVRLQKDTFVRWKLDR
jgi:hypothetical protein